MRFSTGLRALSLATLVAIVTLSVIPTAATAADPIEPTQLVEPTPAPSLDPVVAPDPSVAPDTTVDTEPTPEPTTVPDPTASPEPTPTAAPEIVAPTPAPAATVAVRRVVSPRPRVVRIALNQRGDRYASGAVGPNAFDCSGLVRYAYRKAGVSSRLGGGHSARAMYVWGRRHHLTSRHRPRIGDVVVYGRGSHVGIWIGNGRVVSALNGRKGIRVTRLHALTSGFTTFIHTRVR